MALSYATGTTPLACNPSKVIEDKILIKLNAGGSTGGGGGTSNDSQGTVDPVSAPSDPTKTAFYTNLTSGVIFVWNVTNQAWQ